MKSYEVVPVEVWQHIISIALYFPGYMDPDVEGFSELALNALFANEEKAPLSRVRGNLRLVCRSWSTFVAQNPYSVVDLSSSRQPVPTKGAADLVFQAHRIKCGDILRLESYCGIGGQFQAQILILDHISNTLLHYSPNKFISFFSNLIAVRILAGGSYNPSRSITCRLLGQLPNLRHLFITYYSHGPYIDVMNFPNLIRLSFITDSSLDSINGLSFGTWRLGNLTNLIIGSVISDVAMGKLMIGLELFGRKLKSLLIQGDRGVFVANKPKISSDIWKHCPFLQEIGWDMAVIRYNPATASPPPDHPINSFTYMINRSLRSPIQKMAVDWDIIRAIIGLKGVGQWVNLSIIVLPYFTPFEIYTWKKLDGISPHCERIGIRIEDHTGKTICPVRLT